MLGLMVAVAESIDSGFELGFCVGGVDDGGKKTVLRVNDGLFRLVEPWGMGNNCFVDESQHKEFSVLCTSREKVF